MEYKIITGLCFQQLPPTDSRLRPDCRELENGDLGMMIQSIGCRETSRVLSRVFEG